MKRHSHQSLHYRLMARAILIWAVPVLPSSAVAAPRKTVKPKFKPKVQAGQPKGEVELRIASKKAMEVRLAHGTVITVPPQLMQVQAANYSYRNGSDGIARTRTLLKGNADTPATVTFGAVQISGAEIEVETALTEVVFETRMSMPDEVTLVNLGKAMLAAPYSPRFRTAWDYQLLSNYRQATQIYDRRTQRLHETYNDTSDIGEIVSQRTWDNVSAAELERAAREAIANEK